MGRVGTRRQSKQGRKGGSMFKSPTEPEWRPEFTDALPVASIEEQFREMFANDPEAIEWRQAEERAEWAARR